MNFLAHAYLSANNPDVLLGNFFADAVKGNFSNDYPEGISTGISLHRLIDSFTDTHPVFITSKKRIRSEYDKYSGIIVDIYYDHFLACNWKNYSEQPLKEFSQYIYQLLITNYRVLHAKSKRILPFLVTQDWLTNYSNFQGLKRVFEGMDRRTRNRSGMRGAVEELKLYYHELEHDFKGFFPDVILRACDFLHENNLSCYGIKERVA